jgi:hypothetical protein
VEKKTYNNFEEYMSDVFPGDTKTQRVSITIFVDKKASPIEIFDALVAEAQRICSEMEKDWPKRLGKMIADEVIEETNKAMKK